jgi:hypothetical protein
LKRETPVLNAGFINVPKSLTAPGVVGVRRQIHHINGVFNAEINGMRIFRVQSADLFKSAPVP